MTPEQKLEEFEKIKKTIRKFDFDQHRRFDIWYKRHTQKRFVGI